MKNKRSLLYTALFIYTTASVFVASSFMGGAQNGDNTARQAGTALTETDFVKDPSLFAVPEAGVVATFLENPNSTFEPGDTGAVGMDIIPFKYARGMNQTFCWQDDNKESRHFMTLVETNGTEVLRVEANGACLTEFINEGNYEMRIQHDDSGEGVIATVFSIPEGDADNSFETVLSTDKCGGCDLSGANFSDAVLTDTDLHGADLTGADLSGADLSGTNLSDALLAGADLTGANLTGADLSGADLTDALTANANFTEANLTHAISFDQTKSGEESITAQEEPEAPGPEPCPNGNLRPTAGDIVIDHTCNVPAGTYQYGNINIIKGGTLNFQDENINFWAKSILIQNEGSLIAGTQQNPIGTNGQITIHLYGKEQGLGGKGITCKTADNQTDGMCGVDKNIWMRNDPPNPNACTPDSLPGPVSDCFYRYHPLPVDTGDDNGYFGYKVISVSYGGTLQLFGKKGATYPDTNPDPSKSGKSWVRLAADLKGGESQLTVDDHLNPVDWKKDDLIVVTTTDYLPAHSERLTIKANPTMKDMSGNTIIEVNEKIQYPHSGTAYDLSSVPSRLGLAFTKAETRAAVALLTRSIRIVSGCNSDSIADCKLDCGYDDCFPVSQGFIGGHTIARQGFKTFQVQGVEFYQLGQGGRLGHYPVHFHVARKTPKDTFVKDCSVHDSMTRWITLHATQDVLLARNVGYMSTGHGYYLEDGTEINNRLYSNIGILARSAADNAQNPRKVPGILSSPKVCSGAQTKICKSNADCTGMEGTCILPPTFPFLSDWVHPTVFWFMNGWNDVEYNMAAGAGACGACYWPVLGSISTFSKNLKWDSYASIQKGTGRGGTAPIKKFKGNYCTTAMNSFNSTPDTASCHGVIDGSVRLNQIENSLAPAPNPDRGAETHYPTVTQTLPAYTKCDATDCGSVQLCAIDNRSVCMVTVLDRYTSSFNWVETNFSAIWLRPRWFLVQNSVITDVQNAGLTFVTGGDYTHSSVISGNWMLARKNVFIGNTQQNNAFASNAGPFVKGGLKCENSETNYCISRDQGITMPLSNFGMNQRFFNIYDGPSLQDSNAYLDIKKTFIDDCTFPNNNQQCNNSEWMYGRVLGVPGDAGQKKGYLPNAAIAWKQQNGFYYPPAFHSKNLFFDERQSPHGVDIRHFVIEPLFAPETANTWFKTSAEVKDHYAQWNDAMFDNFTAIDRQTILNDDDGSLTGLSTTVSVNEDVFFNAPVETVECRSDGTAKTSPYEHVTTVVYPGCASNGTCGADKMSCTQDDVCHCLRDICDDTCDWCRNCTSTGPTPCYGVPLYRQFLTKSENDMRMKGQEPDTKIRMMGPSVFGRINLTTNHGKYYISTTDGAMQQSPTPLKSIFRKGDKYYVFLVYAKPSARQTYQIYVGANANLNSDFPQNVEAVGANLATKALAFDSICAKLDSSLCEKDSTTMTDFPKNWERHYDSATGILTVTMDLSNFKTQFDNARQDICQPGTFCTPSGNQCQCSSSLDPELKKECDDGKICSEWAVKDIDCPVFAVTENNNLARLSRCVGFSFTIPSDGNFVADGKDHRPKDTDPCFPKNMDWNVAWDCVKEPLAGACASPNNRPIPETQFCTDNKTPICGANVVMGTEGDDLLTGTPESNIIYGLGGNDIIEGRNGSDWISGGPGDDEIRGGRGDDIIFGEEGDDFIKGGGGTDELDGGSEADVVKGGTGKDICVEGEDVRGCEQ
ncbi:MAG: pentapeptide repeat-containing protein [Thermodesulfobacteriota bacterium]